MKNMKTEIANRTLESEIEKLQSLDEAHAAEADSRRQKIQEQREALNAIKLPLAKMIERKTELLEKTARLKLQSEMQNEYARVFSGYMQTVLDSHGLDARFMWSAAERYPVESRAADAVKILRTEIGNVDLQVKNLDAQIEGYKTEHGIA